MVKLFELQNGQVIPTEHCHTLKFLREIMEEYPENYLKVYQYFFYKTYPSDENPFFDVAEEDVDKMIADELDINFSLEDDLIVQGIEKCVKLYETPAARAYRGAKSYMDKMSDAFRTNEISFGRDGSAAALLQMAKNFDSVRQSFKSTYADLKEEQAKFRGNKSSSYDIDD